MRQRSKGDGTIADLYYDGADPAIEGFLMWRTPFNLLARFGNSCLPPRSPQRPVLLLKSDRIGTGNEYEFSIQVSGLDGRFFLTRKLKLRVPPDDALALLSFQRQLRGLASLAVYSRRLTVIDPAELVLAAAQEAMATVKINSENSKLRILGKQINLKIAFIGLLRWIAARDRNNPIAARVSSDQAGQIVFIFTTGNALGPTNNLSLSVQGSFAQANEIIERYSGGQLIHNNNDITIRLPLAK